MGLNRQTLALLWGGGDAPLDLAGGVTRYEPLGGYGLIATTESPTPVKFNDSYTLSLLSTKITFNNLTGASTFRLRKNGVNGNQVLSIPASTTGTFEDTVNTDNLISGDTGNSQIVTGAGVSIQMTYIVYLLEAVAQTTTLIGSPATWGRNATQWHGIAGEAGTTSIEARVQSLFRTAATLSNLRCVVTANTLTGGATTFRFRKNGVNGNQVLSIPASTTGTFEDTTNSDSISPGDLVNWQAADTNTAGSNTASLLQCRLASAIRMLLSIRGGGASIGFGLTRYIAIEGDAAPYATEANHQLRAPAAFTGRNASANIYFNSLNGAATFRFRKNGVNGNQVLSIPASTTGTFEDLVNTDSVVYTDLINWQIVTGGSAGTLGHNCLGVEQVPSVPTRSPSSARAAVVARQAPGARLPAASRSSALADP